MINTTRELRGIKDETAETASEALAVIHPPKQNEGHEDWSCVVHCPSLFDSDKRITGVDAEQALKLAEMFVKQMLESNGYRLRE